MPLFSCYALKLTRVKFSQIKDRKRKRSQEDKSILPSSATPSRKRPRTSPPQFPVEITISGNAAIGDSGEEIDPLEYWRRELRWPKEYFEAEKDVWRVVQLITRERKRKELQPVLDTLDNCLERTQGLRDPDSKAFRKQIRELQNFADLADRVMERIASKRSGIILPWILKFLA